MTRIRASEARITRPDGVAPDAVVSVFRVPAEVAGQRVDVFLQNQLKRTSRTRAQEILRVSGYDGRGHRLRPSSRVQEGQTIVLWRAPWDETPVPTVVPIVHEDEHLFAVNKPPHLPVHPTARYHKNTLIKVLERARPDTFVSLGHRLDRETSGVLLVSKSSACDRALKKRLEARDDIEKTYVAYTWGDPSTSEVAAGRDRFRYERSVELDPTSRTKVKMRLGVTDTALWAATRFEVLERKRSSTGSVYTKVQCELETGRQHQIRLHLAALGTPIVGDKLYGPDEMLFARCADGEMTEEDVRVLEMDRHALHAWKLELRHPMTDEPLSITAPVPEDMQTFWNGIV
ncbi:MAG: RluA family pseudouridine synthase [Polyangiaceae bacterium]